MIRQVVHRVQNGYENQRLKKTNLFKRIYEVISLLFNLKTERDEIHELSWSIFQKLHAECLNKIYAPVKKLAPLVDIEENEE